MIKILSNNGWDVIYFFMVNRKHLKNVELLVSDNPQKKDG